MGGVVDIVVTYPEVVPGMLVIGEIKLKQVVGGGIGSFLQLCRKRPMSGINSPLVSHLLTYWETCVGGTKRYIVYLHAT